jgi:hypothetical protein
MKTMPIFAAVLAVSAGALAATACGGAAQSGASASGRCERQRASCEASCESRVLPGSSEKAPEVRGEMEADSCRQSCITPYEACRRAVLTGGSP